MAVTQSKKDSAATETKKAIALNRDELATQFLCAIITGNHHHIDAHANANTALIKKAYSLADAFLTYEK